MNAGACILDAFCHCDRNEAIASIDDSLAFGTWGDRNLGKKMCERLL
jgi:hypothetical protein